MHRVFAALAAILTLVATAACGQGASSPAPVAATPIAGMPSTDHTWTSADFKAALDAFSALTELPHIIDPNAAAAFANLTDPATVAPCRDKATPLEGRMNECLDLLDSSNKILRLYALAQQRDTSYSEEVIRILGFELQAATAMTALIDEFAPTLDPNDPTYATRMQGAAQARGGYLQIVQGALTTLSVDRRLYSDEAATRFARILADTYPTLTRDAPPSTKAEFDRQISQIARQDRSATVKEALQHYANPS